MREDQLNFKLRQHNISDQLTEKVPLSALVYRDEKYRRMICVCPPLDNTLVYFKVYDGRTFWESTKCARIDMLEPKYIHCDDIPKECQWILNEDEKNWLISTLKIPALALWSEEAKKHISDYELKEIEHLTIWDAIISVFLDNSYCEKLDTNFIETLQLPDYSLLSEDADDS